MAVVMMGGDEKEPVFHDFLGMSCEDSQPRASITAGGGDGGWAKGGEKRTVAVTEAEASVGGSSGGHGLVSGNSDVGSVLLMISFSLWIPNSWLNVHALFFIPKNTDNSFQNMLDVAFFKSRKNAISGPESSNTFSGRKRSNSDSAYMGLIRDRILPVGSDSHESSRTMKMFGKEVVSERPGRSHDYEIPFTMQPPPRPTSSLILQPPICGRPDSLISKWERPVPTNPSQMMHYPSRFGQGGTLVDKLSSSYAPRDASSGAILISQAAADEGSRTGIKGSGLMNVINPTSGAVERNSNSVLPSNNRPKAPQSTEPESSNAPSRHNITSTSRQMTIFYAGQAHVFDDVHPNKADVIIALAGSNGGSWSTTYSAKSSVCRPLGEAKLPNGENDLPTNNIALSTQGNPVRGLRQVARIPVSSDPPNLTAGALGAHQTGRVDTRPLTPTAELDTLGKRDV